MKILEVNHLSKTYGKGDTMVKALDDVSFAVEQGEFVAIIGPSGSGKSTLLHILGGVDTPTSGSVIIGDEDISKLNETALAVFRRRQIGLVYQFYNLIPNLTALENVEIATQLSKNPLDAEKVLEQVGLRDRMNNFPAQLSGGEQQRVAIARALAKNPGLLLCDEPTGALDYQTGKAILKLLQDTSREKGMTVVIITHNSALTAMADRVVRIKNGTVIGTETNGNPTPVEDIEW